MKKKRGGKREEKKTSIFAQSNSTICSNNPTCDLLTIPQAHGYLNTHGNGGKKKKGKKGEKKKMDRFSIKPHNHADWAMAPRWEKKKKKKGRKKKKNVAPA